MSNIVSWLDTQIARESEARDQYWLAAVKQVGIMTGRIEAFQEMLDKMQELAAAPVIAYAPVRPPLDDDMAQPFPESNGVQP